MAGWAWRYNYVATTTTTSNNSNKAAVVACCCCYLCYQTSHRRVVQRAAVLQCHYSGRLCRAFNCHLSGTILNRLTEISLRMINTATDENPTTKLNMTINMATVSRFLHASTMMIVYVSCMDIPTALKINHRTHLKFFPMMAPPTPLFMRTCLQRCPRLDTRLFLQLVVLSADVLCCLVLSVLYCFIS